MSIPPTHRAPLATQPTGIPAAGGVLQRVLMSTDGNVGRILEDYAGEPIVAVVLQQSTSAHGEANHALELAADEERLTRRALLRTGASDRTLLYAETLVALTRLPPLVRSGLLSTAEPIGRLLTAARLETFREILSAGTTPAGAVAAHFDIAPDDAMYVRTYRIINGGRPIMLISEQFPTTGLL